MSTDNTSKFMFLSSEHIVNIDRTLKNIKSEIMADFVYVDHWELIIATNKVTSQFDLNTIESYIKNINVIDSDLKNLWLFSQNVWKNRTLTDIILENKKDFDILFIHEPPWSFIYTILSSSSIEEDRIVDALNHLDWLIFSRSLINDYDHPRVIIYINMWLVHLHFSLRKDIFYHRYINCFLFFNNSSIFIIF